MNARINQVAMASAGIRIKMVRVATDFSDVAAEATTRALSIPAITGTGTSAAGTTGASIGDMAGIDA